MPRLWSKIKKWFSPEPPQKETELYQVHRLSAEAYAQLESRLPNIGLPRTPEEAAYQVGMQHVLAELRKGFVIG